jgi:predicted dehydrogenase
MIGSNAPIYETIEATLAASHPELVIVCTKDSTHDDIIVAALESGADVISEKPMATTIEKIRRIRDAEKRTGRHVDVSFNYRFAPTAARLKQLLLSGVIGTLTSVDFHWYLDNTHGADYFRRWHAYTENSGSLFVHKATHHFDLLNWFIAADPESVSAFGEQRNYGRNGPFRWTRCRDCPYADRCNYYFDMSADPFLDALYEDPSALDGYHRDACVYREDIDIPDTMTATLRYENKVAVSYSLNTFMPIEGYTIAFNGTEGRIETRLFEKQPFEVPDHDEILVVKSFGGGVERIVVPHAAGGHFGGDQRMRDLMFRGGDDPLGQRAGSRAGAMSVLVGIAALKSSREGRRVTIAELGDIGG